MKCSLFVYTRLEMLDYRLLYAPSKSILDGNNRWDFIDFAREVINVDNVLNGDIDFPRWSIIKRQNIVLIGLGCNNEILGNLNKDYAERSVRGFFGVVIENPDSTVIDALSSIEFYKSIYNAHIIPLWNTKSRDDSKVNSIECCIDIPTSNAENTFHILDLNNNNALTCILSQNTNFKDAIYSALNYNSIDIVFNLNNLQHITSSELYHFLNATTIGDKEELGLHTIKKEQEHYSSDNRQTDKQKTTRNKQKDKQGVDDYHKKQYDSIVDEIYKYIQRCGLKIELFLKTLANKCGYCVVKKKAQTPSNVDVGESPKEDLKVVLSEQVKEQPLYVETEETKANRKEGLNKLREQYKRNKELYTKNGRIEELPDIERQIDELKKHSRIEEI